MYKKYIIEVKRKQFRKFLDNVIKKHMYGLYVKLLEAAIIIIIIKILNGIRSNDHTYTNSYMRSKEETLKYHFSKEQMAFA